MPFTFTRVWLLLLPLRKAEDNWPMPPLVLTSIARLSLNRLERFFGWVLSRKSLSILSTAIIISSDGVEEVPSYACENVVDTTGAGDLFAAGFLYGISVDLRLYECAKLGSFCASNVINLFGPRPHKNLFELAKNEGLLI